MKHRFEPTGKSRTGWPELTMVLNIGQVNWAAIYELPRYLVDNIEDLYQQAKKQQYQMFPIQLEIGGKTRISEKNMWALVIELVQNSENLVVEYIDKLCSFVDQSKEESLFYHDERHFAGSYALCEYLDRFFETDGSINPNAANIYRTFFKFLRNCDLEFETFQDEYIEKILDKWILFDKNEPLELVFFRLFNGQNTDKDFRYLHKYLEIHQSRRGLKKLIDLILDNEDDPYIYDECRYEANHYLTLCAAIYGSNQQATDDVMDYVKKRVGDNFEELHDSFYPTIRRIQRECDAYREFQKPMPELIDSGFHIYDRQKKEWLPREND